MSLFKKATKRIAALAMASFGVLSAVSSAAYTDDFVSNNKMNGKIVYGADADKAAADSILTSLKNGIGSTEEKVKITYKNPSTDSEEGESYKFVSSGSDTMLVKGLKMETESIIDDDDMPSFLEQDIEVEDLASGSNYDITPTILINENGFLVDYEDNSEHIDKDVDYKSDFVDFAKGEHFLELKAEFNKDLDVVDSDGTFTMFGRDFVFDPDQTDNSKLKMYTSSNTVSLDNNEEKQVTHDGVEYTIGLQGGASSVPSANIVVNGEKRSVEEGKDEKIGGLNVFVKEVSVNDIMENNAKDISVELFIGSDAVEIPTTARFITETPASGDWKTFDDETGEDIEGLKVAVRTSADNEWDIKSFHFKLDPNAVDRTDTDLKNKHYTYLERGESFNVPFFDDLMVSYEGTEDNYDAVDSEDEVIISNNGDEIEVTFTNKDGSGVLYEDIVLFETDGTTMTPYEESDVKFVSTTPTSGLKEGAYFLITKSSRTQFWEITNIVDDGTNVDVTFTSMGDDEEEKIIELTNATRSKSVFGVFDVKIASAPNSNIDSVDLEVGTNTQSGTSHFGVYLDKLTFITNDQTEFYINMDTAATATQGADTFSIAGDTGGFNFHFDLSKSDRSRNDAGLDIVGTEKLLVNYLANGNLNEFGSYTGNAKTALVNTDNKHSKIDKDNDEIDVLTSFGTYMYADDTGEDVDIMVYLRQTPVDYDFQLVTGKGGSSMNSVTVTKSQEANRKSQLEADGYEIVKSEDVSGSTAVDVSGVSVVSANDVSVYNNLISVGGPAVNKVTAELLGMTLGTWGTDSGVTEGKGKVMKISGKNSIVVYGWEAADTKRAADALNSGKLTGNSVEV